MSDVTPDLELDLKGLLCPMPMVKVSQQIGLRDKTLQWQTGYGVVSFGTGDLDWVKAYVRNQRQHHAEGKISDRLEWFGVPEEKQDAHEWA